MQKIPSGADRESERKWKMEKLAELRHHRWWQWQYESWKGEVRRESRAKGTLTSVFSLSPSLPPSLSSLNSF